ncbi:MAG: hypothetical protein FWD94_07270 [Treponema sp.]|nr:hypothetical protein [Treponema sp.]
MKRTHLFLYGLLALLLATGLLGCKKDDPIDLAKQTYELNQQALGALLNPAKAAGITKKVLEIGKKVERMSTKDQNIYAEELARLTGQRSGGLFEAADSLLNAASGLADKAAGDVQKLTDMSQDAFGIAEQATGLLGAASLMGENSLQDAQGLMDATKGAVDAAEQAAGLVNSLFGNR